VITADLPALPIDGTRPGLGLLARVNATKYADQHPLNHQTDILARNCVAVARQRSTDRVAVRAAS
jgi:transposase